MSESVRLKALYRYDVMDSSKEEVFEGFAKLAAEICEAPVALVAMVDQNRAWFKAHYGTPISEAERCHTFCDHTIRDNKVMVVPNALEDDRFKNNPFVTQDPFIRFYAGAPLIDSQGQRIGALCVMSPHPRDLSDRQCRALQSLAVLVMQTLEGRLQRDTHHNAAVILSLLNKVASVANQSSDADDALRTCLVEFSQFTGAKVGHYIPVESGKLNNLGLWHMADEAKYMPLRTVTEGLEFIDGYGMPGQALLTKGLVWARGEEMGDKFPRAVICNTIGLPCAFCFPVMVNDEVVGVFEFYYGEDYPVDQELLRVTQHISAQIGHVIMRHRAETALAKEREFQQAVLENMGDGIIACDADGVISILNNSMREYYSSGPSAGVTEEGWVERYRLFHADGKTPMALEDIPLKRAMKGEVLKDVEIIIETDDGKHRNLVVKGRAMFSADGTQLGAVCVTTDVTDSLKAQARIKAQTRQMEALIEASPVGISALDENYIYTMWNPGIAKIYGYGKDEVIGTKGPDFGSLAEPERLARMSAAENGVVHNYYDRRRKDGSMVAVSIAVFPIYGDTGAISGYMAITLDVSDLRAREKSLLAANRMLQSATEQKSAFLANMSHELRTPLNGVIGMAEILLDTALDADQRQYVEVLQQSADNLLKIISDLLDFSKVEAGRLDLESVPFELDQLLNSVHDTVELSASRKKLELTRAITGLAANRFVGDPGRIRQVLLNLLSNAIKFTAEGHVRTSVKLEAASENRTKIRVEVEDSGIGIEEEVIAKLFRAFSQADSSTTRNYGGTGLGLSISKRLIELMKGDMGVISEVGKGSTFWFTLELPNGAREEVRSKDVLPRRSVPSSVQPLRVLVAEDDATNRSIAMLMLEKLGVTAEAVNTGIEVLEALKTSQYDIVLMDCQMPGMDGYKTSQAIRANVKLQAMPIIALTAHALKGDHEKCLAAGMTDFLSKPIKFDDLQDAITRHRPGEKSA